MLTPRFSCSQTPKSVIISIYVPSVRASEIEIDVDGTLFSLHINPYFLRLTFPKRVIEDGESDARYDPGSGYLTVTLTKEVPGEEFEDLDLLGKLLAPEKEVRPRGAPIIEVLGSKDIESNDGVEEIIMGTGNMSLNLEEERRILLEAEKNDWRLPQAISTDEPRFITSSKRAYGFLDMHSGYFRHAAYSQNEVNDLGGEAETLHPDERPKRGEERVNKKFDENYYLADYVNDEEIQEFIKWKNPHTYSPTFPPEFTDSENLAMLRLPRKEYLPTPPQTRSLYLTLLTVLFSTAYDTRTTLADPTSESAWTICILTPAFASLAPPPSNTPSLAAALVPSYKRALSFPLYRNLKLCERCKMDVVDMLRGGRRGALKVLMGCKGILEKHDVYYVYAKIWVEDFCVWVQNGASDEVLYELAEELAATVVNKTALGWDLGELEAAAREAMGGEGEDSDDEDDEREIEVTVLP